MEDKQLEEALAESIEKSFNDSELEDIMNEIENLEKEFSSDVTEKEAGLTLQKAKDNDLQKVIDAEVESISTHIDEAQEPMVAQANLDEIPEEMMMESEEMAEVVTEDDDIVKMSEETMETEDSFDEDDFAQMEDESDEMMASTEKVETIDNYEESEELIAQDIADIEAAVTQMEEESNVVALTPKATNKTTQTTSKSSELDFNASGSMDLSINFKIAGQTANLKVENGGLVVTLNGVQLSIDETSGCSVKMAGGVQFSVPLNPTATSAKKDVA